MMTIAAFLGALSSQIWAMGQAYSGMKTYQLERRKSYSDAITSMREAMFQTSRFLKNPNFSDENKIYSLANLWNEASGKVAIVNPNLGDILANKSRFWNDPQLYVQLGIDNDVIKLRDISDEIDTMRIQMGNSQL